MPSTSADTTVFTVHLSEDDSGLLANSQQIAQTLETAGRLHSVIVSPSSGHKPSIHRNQIVLPRMFVPPNVSNRHCIITGKESRLCIPSFASLISRQTRNDITFHIALDATGDRMEPDTLQTSDDGIRMISTAFLNHNSVQFALTIDGGLQGASKADKSTPVHIHSRTSDMLERLGIE